MRQPSTAANQPQQSGEHKVHRLGPFLCWAVVFADIGTSIYYVPGILYATVKNFHAAVLAVLTATSTRNEAVIEAAVNNPGKKPVVFLYLGQQTSGMKPELFRLIEPHLNDPQARKILGRANHLAANAKVRCRFVYRRQKPDAAYRVWQALHPVDTIVDPEQASLLKQVHPDRTSRETIPQGEVLHLFKESEDELY